MKTSLSPNTKRKTSSMSETVIDKLIVKLDKCFENSEEYKKTLLGYIQQYCNAERGNAKLLAGQTGITKQDLSNVINGKKLASLERLLEIVKKIREVEKNTKKGLTK